MQENVKAFDKAKADKQRKAYIGSLIMIFVLIVCIILAILAWFTTHKREANTSGALLYAADDYDIRYNTYAGTMLSNGTIVYDETVDWNHDFEGEGQPIPEIFTYPGERRYFKTVISNYETTSLHGTVYFENMFVNTNFVTKSEGGESVNFVSQIEGDTSKQAFDLLNNSTVIIGSIYSIVPLQPFCENITLPRATSDGGNVRPSGTVNVYWYVALNGAKIENTIGEEFLKFKSIRFVPN